MNIGKQTAKAELPRSEVRKSIPGSWMRTTSPKSQVSLVDYVVPVLEIWSVRCTSLLLLLPGPLGLGVVLFVWVTCVGQVNLLNFFKRNIDHQWTSKAELPRFSFAWVHCLMSKSFLFQAIQFSQTVLI